ncbi:hypothetical protein T265_04075 [Opisthorchis viverrini]|uniref:Uncharacterized protein n=1 Tax=Opisthorchis viverrini TaxID=6198 RepID=A0A074ZQ73_OPIVI|nr:hypothetical protein T265_04075 [Opisthorchis viverrini]KER29226.1 hypothetical protein T265_04075 [Opisthorchis viverrini]
MDGRSRQADCLTSPGLLKRLRQFVDKHFNTVSAASEGIAHHLRRYALFRALSSTANPQSCFILTGEDTEGGMFTGHRGVNITFEMLEDVGAGCCANVACKTDVGCMESSVLNAEPTKGKLLVELREGEENQRAWNQFEITQRDDGKRGMWPQTKLRTLVDSNPNRRVIEESPTTELGSFPDKPRQKINPGTQKA